MEMTDYFISDTHFGHQKVLEFDNRPYDTIEQHDNALITKWNLFVRPQDTVYHLGDFGLGPIERLEEILSQLNGRIILIAGNHDKQVKKKLGLLFDSIHDYLEIKISRKKIILCHYPIEVWKMKEAGSIHLHGHCHGGSSRPARVEKGRYDMCVKLWDYKPVSEQEILLYHSEREVEDGED